MIIFDTHCHYNMEPLFENWPEYWRQAQAAGVEKSSVIGVNIETSQRALDIAAVDPNLYPILGIHPNEWNDGKLDIRETLGELEQLARSNKGAIAGIGETGLDYFHLPKENHSQIKARQQQAFKLHILLAQKLGVPLVIHVRDKQTPAEPVVGNAYWDALSVLKSTLIPDQAFILHCVSGPIAYIQEAVALGAYIGIAGNSTYPHASAIRDIIAITPADKHLLETDAPFLPPQSHRGESCQPAWIAHTADFLEAELNVDPTQLYTNAVKLFVSY